MARGPRPLGPEVLRAAKLTNVPGVTIAEACQRFGVTKSAVSRARREHTGSPQLRVSVEELVLASLTHNGLVTTGTLGDLSCIAGWIDYVNKDACTVADVRAHLATFQATGQLTIEGDRWILNRPWP